MPFGNGTNDYMNVGKVGFGAIEQVGAVQQNVAVVMPPELADRVLETETTPNKGYELCPFTMNKPNLDVDLFLESASYICGVNGKSAREGMIRRTPIGSETPCRMEYAKNCELYKKGTARI